jgi:hypothetical protein
MKAPLLIGGLSLLTSFFLVSCRTHQAAESVDLFDGKSLHGWKHILADPSVPRDDVWSVQDGILTCKGKPIGAIYKGPSIEDFRLVVEYRWAPDTEPGNSGIFSRIHGDMRPLPRTVEVQLQHGNAGDLLGLQGRTIAAGQPRFFAIKAHPDAGDIAGVRKVTAAENKPGEWNQVEIEASGPNYRVWLNGKLVNEVTGVEQVAGPIGLQSEGGVIQFRKVTVIPK